MLRAPSFASTDVRCDLTVSALFERWLADSRVVSPLAASSRMSSSLRERPAAELWSGCTGADMVPFNGYTSIGSIRANTHNVAERLLDGLRHANMCSMAILHADLDAFFA